MLYPTLLRTFGLSPTADPASARGLSAASGLVHTLGRLYLIADDSHCLYHLAFDPSTARQSAPLQAVRLLPGELPALPTARKRAKPDLESLLLLPATPHAPQGRLLCLGSGGKPLRRRAVELPLLADGGVDVEGIVVHDLTALFTELQQGIDDLNIEGGFLHGNRLCLLQRGNKGPKATNALLSLDGTAFLRWLSGNQQELPLHWTQQVLDFGCVDGVPLCPTDALLLPDGSSVLSLVAEDTTDSVVDGRCAASALALLDPQLQLVALHRLHGAPKVEGVALAAPAQRGAALSLLLVTDADDPSLPSLLLGCALPW